MGVCNIHVTSVPVRKLLDMYQSKKCNPMDSITTILSMVNDFIFTPEKSASTAVV